MYICNFKSKNMSIKFLKIECPCCKWEPDGGKYWQCICGSVWNTFETVGVCQGCNKKWEKTQCPGPGYPGGCGAWSNHDDWYIVPINFKRLFGKIPKSQISKKINTKSIK